MTSQYSITQARGNTISARIERRDLLTRTPGLNDAQALKLPKLQVPNGKERFLRRYIPLGEGVYVSRKFLN